jgi:hypothetical protein
MNKPVPASPAQINDEQRIADVVGRQVRIVGDHPWNGHRARVLGIDKIGMKVAIMRNDAMDGHEAYITKREHFIAIPKSLETEY